MVHQDLKIGCPCFISGIQDINNTTDIYPLQTQKSELKHLKNGLLK